MKPRDFVEKLGFRDWQQVKDYVATLDQQPIWWDYPAEYAEAKRKFDSLLPE